MPRKKRLSPDQSVLSLNAAQGSAAQDSATQRTPQDAQPSPQQYAPQPRITNPSAQPKAAHPTSAQPAQQPQGTPRPTTPKAQPPDIDYLVSLTFDSDPLVRKKTAQTLGTIDDPRAIFALIELSSDKEPQVQEAARTSLERFKTQKDDQEAIMSIAQLLAERKTAKAEDPSAAAVAAKQKLLPSLEKLFHHDDKSPKSARDKIMSSLLDKFFLPKKHADPLSSIENMHQENVPARAAQPPTSHEHKDALTREEVDQIRLGHDEPKKQPAQPHAEEDALEEAQDGQDSPSTLQGSAQYSGAADATEYEMQYENAEAHSEGTRAEGSTNPFYYKLAYDLAKTAGSKKNVLMREQKRIIANLKKDVELAFKLAMGKVEEEGSPTLSGLKPGMKRLCFAPMQVLSVSEMQFGKKGAYAKIVITDGQKSVPLLVPSEKARGISASDQLSLRDAQADYLVETSELVLLLPPKSKMLISR
ncbi:HEAT repeat domain-containing protein [Candidatus Micrarchaeota archaeon]|nr:HEAT repeat domain-containing protein [Candidatus Micrarchaeota archaeon]